MVHGLFQGLQAIGNGPSIAYLVAGALVGMLFGVIPGLSTVVILSIILILVYHIDLTGTLCLFLGAQAGSFYSASISSILLNTPAHPEAFAVTFDGYPMARKGQPGRALGLSAASTCLGGFVGFLVLIAFVPILDKLPGLFHPPEYVALILLAMFLIGTLGTDSAGKAVTSAGIGFMLSSVGPSTLTSTPRLTLGTGGLYSGISLVALAMGLFAIPQMVMVFGTGTTMARQDLTGKEIPLAAPVDMSQASNREVVSGVFETLRHLVLLTQSGLIGALTGLVPGIGGFAANFMSYGIAKQISRKKEQFGTGIAEGVIAPESSSLSKESGSMIPILALGIPGGIAGALFISALAIKNITPGPGLAKSFPVLPYEIAWVILLSGVIGTVAGVILGPHIARVTRTPGPILVGFILPFSVLGTYVAALSFFAVMELFVFGLVGLCLRRLRYSLAAFVLGLVLGPTMEANIYLTHEVYPGLSFLSRRPFATTLLIVAIGILLLKALEMHRYHKKERRAEQEELAHKDDEVVKARVTREQRLRRSPYPLLSTIVSGCLLGVSLAVIVYCFESYDFETGLFPEIAGMLVLAPLLVAFPKDIVTYVAYRRGKSGQLASYEGGATNREMHVEGHVVAVGSVQTALGRGNLMDQAAAESAVPDLLEVMAPTTFDGKGNFAVAEEKAWNRNGQYQREIVALAWLGVLVLLCYVFGFFVAVPGFVAAYGITSSKRFFKTLKGRILFWMVAAAVMWFVTYEMFRLSSVLFTPKINL